MEKVLLIDDNYILTKEVIRTLLSQAFRNAFCILLKKIKWQAKHVYVLL